MRKSATVQNEGRGVPCNTGAAAATASKAAPAAAAAEGAER